MKLKKAQGLSLNLVIIAAVALIVLIVIIAIFSGKTREFGKSSKNISGDFENKCKLPGVFGRNCNYDTPQDCEDKGGMAIGIQNQYGDCNGKTCCQM